MNPTPITWCDLTWNPITGCTRGCDYCYARKVAQRFGAHIEPEPTTTACVSFSTKRRFPFDFFPTIYPHRLDEPLRRKKPATIFLGSMGDLFDPAFSDGYIFAVFHRMKLASQHTFLLLTKQPKRAEALLYHWHRNHMSGFPLGEEPLPNLWLGVTVTNQADADERIPLLLATPAAHRFVSCEPLLGPVDFGGIDGALWDIDTRGDTDYPAIEWLVVGGKTPGKPLHEARDHTTKVYYRDRPEPGTPRYVKNVLTKGDGQPEVMVEHVYAGINALRSLRDQCLAAGVPLHYKHGGTNPELDGVVYDAIPERSHP